MSEECPGLSRIWLPISPTELFEFLEDVEELRNALNSRYSEPLSYHFPRIGDSSYAYAKKFKKKEKNGGKK